LKLILSFTRNDLIFNGEMSERRPPFQVFYKVELNKTEWTLPEKYKNPLPIGSGAYGQVW